MIRQRIAAGFWSLDPRQTMPWFPVGMGCGIAVYFALNFEPSVLWCCLTILPAALLFSGAACRLGTAGYLIVWALLAISLGFSVSVLHTDRLSVRMLDRSLAETVEGRVVAVSRSASGAPRVALDEVLIYGLDPSETPKKIRISLHPEDAVPVPGMRLRVYGRVSAPSGPVEPGGYDFRRQAFFQGLGAVGYAQGKAIIVPVSEPRNWEFGLWLAGIRDRMSNSLRSVLPGPEGAFAAAIIVGDRAYIDDADAEALRSANLAHLLAISGLHMGILTGLLFTGCRLLMSLSGWLSLRYPIKKLAALCALLGAVAYLGLSGATVATQRAFIMVSVALVAVLMDRRAITLRAVAVAATLVLLLRPISLLEPGFQMSFAATTALVAGYGELRDRTQKIKAERSTRGKQSVLRRIGEIVLLYVGGLVFTSILAGLATAPFAAFHFNRTAPYGLLANLAAVPVMGLLVAPSAIAAGFGSLVGLAEPFLILMGQGIRAILDVAHWVAALPNSVGYAPAQPQWTVVAFALGGLMLALLRGRIRLTGILPIAIACAGWFAPTARPDILIASDARLIGVMGESGRSLDQARQRSFVAHSWLRRDGDPASQEEAFLRAPEDSSSGAYSAELSNGYRIVVLRGLDPQDNLNKISCDPNDLVLNFRSDQVPKGCKSLGESDLKSMGALAVYGDEGGLRIVPSTTDAGRPWSFKRDQ
ncbi:MAG: ComEC/Rec2 family competence protein [Pseudomonadota bacterium]